MCLSQYGLRAGWYGDRLPAGTRDFSLVSNVQTASRSQRIPDFLPLGKGNRDVMRGHSSPCGANDKSEYSYRSKPIYVLMMCAGTTL